MSKLREEIKQTKPFGSLEEEVLLNIVRTADALDRAQTELLKRAGLTGSQYNALRILRGAGANGLMCAEIGDRMIARDPDVTRLLDRLEKRGLIIRAREKADRRVVTTRITDEGLAAIKPLDKPLAELSVGQLAHMSRTELETLRDLLERAREKAG